MAGLISNALTTTTPKPITGNMADANTFGYDPNLRTVDAGKETVAGQLDSLLSKDGPYLTRARAGAAQTANSRGLLNSSMAAGAGEAAAIDASLPVANADANTYTTASRDNQASSNTALSQGAGELNTTARTNAAAQNQVAGQKLGAELETGLIGARTGAESQLSAQSAAQSSALSAQGAEQAGTLSAQSAAQAQAQTQLQAEIEKGLITTREQASARLQELQGEIERSLVGTKEGADTALQALKGEQATTLANIEANFKTLMQSSDSAAKLFQTTQSTIAAIQGDPNTSLEQKQSAVNQITQMLQSGLTVMGAIANVDLAGLLDFSAT